MNSTLKSAFPYGEVLKDRCPNALVKNKVRANYKRKTVLETKQQLNLIIQVEHIFVWSHGLEIFDTRQFKT